MKKVRALSKSLLWLHLFVCVVWLCLFRLQELPFWTIHVFIWSILAIQFTWGFTVGLCVGPARAARKNLWWSLLTVFMPLFLLGPILHLVAFFQGPLIAMIYLLCFTAILGSETFCGVLLGAKYHASLIKND
ncbi:MAG: hypothetical protein JWL77_1205 [Chthonomonadaceae bacterium]|nr:hypothetical protein [Chthonomonadaceae bacterium]